MTCPGAYETYLQMLAAAKRHSVRLGSAAIVVCCSTDVFCSKAFNPSALCLVCRFSSRRYRRVREIFNFDIGPARFMPPLAACLPITSTNTHAYREIAQTLAVPRSPPPPPPPNLPGRQIKYCSCGTESAPVTGWRL